MSFYRQTPTASAEALLPAFLFGGALALGAAAFSILFPAFYSNHCQTARQSGGLSLRFLDSL